MPLNFLNFKPHISVTLLPGNGSALRYKLHSQHVMPAHIYAEFRTEESHPQLYRSPPTSFPECNGADADWQPNRKQALNRLDDRFFSTAGELSASLAAMPASDEKASSADNTVGIDSIRQSLTRFLNASDAAGFQEYMKSLYHSIAHDRGKEPAQNQTVQSCGGGRYGWLYGCLLF